jgi:RNA recognition motif-containing protein
MNLYVGHLAYTVTESDLRTAFEAFGTVDRASVITDRDSGRSKGFGFVEMPNNSEADAAIKALNDTALNGRNIKVNEARPRENRPQRGGGGGGGGRY